MKMTDSIGRELGIDVVVKTPSFNDPTKMLNTRPLEYNLEHSGTTFCAVPHGAFALRVISRLGAELLVYQEGKLRIAASIEKGIQYLERDADGNLLMHRPAGDVGAAEVRGEGAGFGSEGISLLEAPLVADTEDGGTENTLEERLIPNEPGLVFVVARLKPDPEIVGHQPPSIEYEVEFQLRVPEEHYEALAGSLSKLVVPELPPNPNDLTSLEPPERPATTFVCSCTGCKSKRS